MTKPAKPSAQTYIVRVVYHDLTVEEYFPAISEDDAVNQMRRHMAEHHPTRSWENAQVQVRPAKAEKAKRELERGGPLTD